MTDGIYIGMAGASARLRQLDAIADNLSNAETPGFRAETPRFEAFLPKEAPSGPAYVAAADTGVDVREGPTTTTGRPLDVRLDEGVWLGVDGGFTRDGALQIDAEGQLLSAGHAVLGASGNPVIVTPGAGDVSIDAQGRVLQNGAVVDSLLLARLGGEVVRVAPTMVAPADPAAAEPVQARVHSGELEGSNASALDATVNLVSAQRAYDHAMQAIQTSRSLDQRAAEIGRIRA